MSGYAWGAIIVGREPRGVIAGIRQLFKELSDHVNKKITDFNRRIMSLGDSLRDIHVTITQVREIAHATS